MHIRSIFTTAYLLLLQGSSILGQQTWQTEAVQHQYQVPLLKGNTDNPLIRLLISVKGSESVTVKSFYFDLKGTSRPKDIKQLRLHYFATDSSVGGSLDFSKSVYFGASTSDARTRTIQGSLRLEPGTHCFWLSGELDDQADLFHEADAACTKIEFDTQIIMPSPEGRGIRQRFGVAVRRPKDDGVHTYRIPGLTTSVRGTLLATYDMRREKSRDLQGHMDIGLSRSFDGGDTWQPMQVVMDMGEWGGLPQKFNGVSDACILSDERTGTLYLAGLWMHGVLDKEGRWIEGLSDTSSAWNHQWRDRGSQPGFDVKQTAQFLIVKSVDDGKTWSEPVNLTRMCKKEDWWLWAPGPGHGITLRDGTLVFPTQGRDRNGRPFSNITYSKDGGLTWKTSIPADTGSTTESMAVEMNDGSVMLNMRANENAYRKGDDNGRAVAVTYDLGKTWKIHESSRRALNEPVCMASIHRHRYTEKGVSKSVLLFSNPNTKSGRHHITIKQSLDEGVSWPSEHWLLLDEWKGFGYSCITSVDEKTVGILYEGSGAHMIFQKFPLKELLD